MYNNIKIYNGTEIDESKSKYYYPRECTIDDFNTEKEKTWFSENSEEDDYIYCFDDPN